MSDTHRDDLGYLRAECYERPETTPRSILKSPSRVTTQKPYEIGDAYGGDNYRGEWRPPGNCHKLLHTLHI